MSQEYDRASGRRAQGGRESGRRARQEEESQRPPHKRRRRRLGPLFALLYVVFVIGISALLAKVGWMAASDMLALNKAPHTATIAIREGATVDEVADILEENGLIEYKFVFKLFAALTKVEERSKITAGTYDLDTDMDYRALIDSMGKGSASRKEVEITITEGMTLDQIFALLEQNEVSTVEKLRDVAANHQFKYSFLKDLPTGDYHRLEGYLFPDTYHFYMGGDPLQILNKMILRFDEVFTDDLRQVAADRGYTVAQIVNIASMIEKETDGSDQTNIASVIYNRLERPNSETGSTLGIDATILYVTGGTVVDVNADTPYNTRIHPGLPPTAISNPGLVAIRAALYPADTEYYYYALGDDGTHSFFRTLKGQQDFIATQERYQTQTQN